jgi:Signal transduction histidine kinase
MELDLRETKIANLLDELVHMTKPAAAANGNEIVLSIASGLGTRRCDPVKLQSMIRQLLDNAVKFTENGRIDLVARIEQGDANDMLVVDVIDTGIGIEPNRIDQLFEKFSVADDSSTSKYRRNGLGIGFEPEALRADGRRDFVESDLARAAALRSGCRCRLEARCRCVGPAGSAGRCGWPSSRTNVGDSQCLRSFLSKITK